MTELLTKAFEELLKLPVERQDELARMLIDVVESDRSIADGVHRLTSEQWVEVDAALAEEGDDASGEELAAFFARNRA